VPQTRFKRKDFKKITKEKITKGNCDVDVNIFLSLAYFYDFTGIIIMRYPQDMTVEIL